MRDLVLLHGWAMTTRVWEPVLDALSASYRVHNLPLPGYPGPTGGSEAGGEALDDWSDQCLAAAPAGAIWVAWSLGALVALNAALRSPGALARLILVAATPKFVASGDWEAGIDRRVLRDFMNGIESGDDKTLKRFVSLQAGGSDDARGLSRWLSSCIVDDRVQGGALRAGLRVLEDTDLRPRLVAVRTPVRVIHGGGDRIVPFAAGAYVAGQAPGGDLVRLETGHAPFVTRPEAFVEAVRSWT